MSDLSGMLLITIYYYLICSKYANQTTLVVIVDTIIPL